MLSNQDIFMKEAIGDEADDCGGGCVDKGGKSTQGRNDISPDNAAGMVRRDSQLLKGSLPYKKVTKIFRTSKRPMSKWRARVNLGGASLGDSSRLGP